VKEVSGFQREETLFSVCVFRCTEYSPLSPSRSVSPSHFSPTLSLSHTHLDSHDLGADAQRTEEGAHRAEQLQLGVDPGDADDVHVPLVVLPLPPALRRLEAPALGEAEPLEREELLELPRRRVLHLQDHARQRRCHLRPQRNLVLLLVREVVHLCVERTGEDV